MTFVEPIRKKSDLRKIEDYLKLKNKRDYIMFKLGINCGLRISDILKLNVENVKNKNYIQLFEQKTGK
ncbi:hypothetical protein IKE67_06860 [bacterium]|nr:hypothetical protein [bacterium]